jgi:flagellin-specific chaperone FliS
MFYPRSHGKKAMLDNYHESDILMARPEQLLLTLYDQAILGCKKQDEGKASSALAKLIDALDFDYAEVSTGLFRLYEYLLRMVWKRNFSQALPILSELRQTWTEAIQKARAA